MLGLIEFENGIIKDVASYVNGMYHIVCSGTRAPLEFWTQAFHQEEEKTGGRGLQPPKFITGGAEPPSQLRALFFSKALH